MQKRVCSETLWEEQFICLATKIPSSFHLWEFKPKLKKGNKRPRGLKGLIEGQMASELMIELFHTSVQNVNL